MSGNRPPRWKFDADSCSQELIRKLTTETKRKEKRVQNTLDDYLEDAAEQYDDPVEASYHGHRTMWGHYFPKEPFPGRLIEIPQTSQLPTIHENPGVVLPNMADMMTNATPSMSQITASMSQTKIENTSTSATSSSKVGTQPTTTKKQLEFLDASMYKPGSYRNALDVRPQKAEQLPQSTPGSVVVLDPNNPLHNVNRKDRDLSLYSPTYGTIGNPPMPFWSLNIRGKNVRGVLIGVKSEDINAIEGYFRVRVFILPLAHNEIVVWVEHPDIFDDPPKAMLALDCAYYFLWSWGRGNSQGYLSAPIYHLNGPFMEDENLFENGRLPSCPEPQRPSKVIPRTRQFQMPAVNAPMPSIQRSTRIGVGRPGRGNTSDQRGRGNSTRGGASSRGGSDRGGLDRGGSNRGGSNRGGPNRGGPNMYQASIQDCQETYGDTAKQQFHAQKQTWELHFPNEPFPGRLIEIQPYFSIEYDFLRNLGAESQNSGMMTAVTPSVQSLTGDLSQMIRYDNRSNDEPLVSSSDCPLTTSTPPNAFGTNRQPLRLLRREPRQPTPILPVRVSREPPRSRHSRYSRHSRLSRRSRPSRRSGPRRSGRGFSGAPT